MDKYHFIGIKGAGMSALAQLLHETGCYVQGSDQKTTFFTQKPLEELGIKIVDFDKENIKDGFTVVASNAYKADHEEVATALKKGVPFYRYHDFLGELVNSFSSIAVTGAHGKTSTTGLMSHVFNSLAPTSYIIGDGSGKGKKFSKYLIFEGCEYRRHFLSYHPDYAIITNIDFDHPDYFSGIEDVKDAFQQFTKQVKKHIIAYGDDQHIRDIKIDTPTLYYGTDSANDLIATDVRADSRNTYFNVSYKGQTLGQFSIPLHGKHNVLNALAVIGVCLLEKFNLDIVREELGTFTGVRRRFAEKRLHSNIVIDDYAHHPTEVIATLEAAKTKYPDKKIVAIFQPHTYSRLYHFIDGFASALEKADEVYLCDIFGSARESAGTVTIEDLLQRVPKAVFLNDENIHILRDYNDSVLLFMGAGDIQKYQSKLME